MFKISGFSFLVLIDRKIHLINIYGRNMFKFILFHIIKTLRIKIFLFQKVIVKSKIKIKIHLGVNITNIWWIFLYYVRV